LNAVFNVLLRIVLFALLVGMLLGSVSPVRSFLYGALGDTPPLTWLDIGLAILYLIVIFLLARALLPSRFWNWVKRGLEKDGSV
jgi:hypothetical protein